MIRASIFLLMLIAALPGCPSDDDAGEGGGACPERVRDTLGFEYGYYCEDSELRLLAESPTPPDCGSSAVAVFHVRGGRGMPRICYFQTDLDSSSGTTSADACRPIACSSRAECPGGFPCVNQICRLGSFELTEDEAFPLCLADIPWPDMCSFDALHPDFADRIEPLLEACPDDGASCTLPPECPQ